MRQWSRSTEDEMSADRDVEDIRSLLRRQPRPATFAADGIVPHAGVTVLAGRPKHGKSWLALDLALGVGTGTTVLGDVPCAEASVLYLALEDSPYRIRRRVDALLREIEPPDDMLVAYRWTRGVKGLAAWSSDHPGGLVVIDVLAKFTNVGSSYQAQYDALGALNDLARERDVAIVVVTHTVKTRPSSDPLAVVLGSTALTGAVDTILILEKESLPPQDPISDTAPSVGMPAMLTRGRLYIDGKDVDNAAWVLERDGARWVRSGGDVPAVDPVTKIDYQILDILGDARNHGRDSLSRREIQDGLPGVPEATIARILRILIDMELITRVERGGYRLSRLGG
jgi:hypothetical protein